MQGMVQHVEHAPVTVSFTLRASASIFFLSGRPAPVSLFLEIEFFILFSKIYDCFKI
jgi:hypothetical protein